MTKEERKIYNKAYRDKKRGKPKRVKLTPEEKRERKLAYQQRWKEANKEKVKAYKKAWNEANREKNAKTTKDWKINNKNKQDAYLLKTREDRLAKMKASREEKKTPFNIVYCIPNYNGLGDNYAGVTNQPEKRMKAHNLKGRLNTENWFILDVVVDRGEALMSESRFHAQGYHGAGGWRNKK